MTAVIKKKSEKVKKYCSMCSDGSHSFCRGGSTERVQGVPPLPSIQHHSSEVHLILRNSLDLPLL